ncbi:MAG: hypothetical protein WDA21_03320 [Bacilli bacterium]
MKKILCVGLMGLLLVVGCEKSGKITEEEKNAYEALENQMVEAAKELLNNDTNDNLIPTSDDRVLTIPLNWLTNGLYIDKKLKDPKDNKTECDESKSYIRVELEGETLKYIPYLICGEYKTKE